MYGQPCSPLPQLSANTVSKVGSNRRKKRKQSGIGPEVAGIARTTFVSLRLRVFVGASGTLSEEKLPPNTPCDYNHLVPELPEVELATRSLRQWLIGRCIAAI